MTIPAGKLIFIEPCVSRPHRHSSLPFDCPNSRGSLICIEVSPSQHASDMQLHHRETALRSFPEGTAVVISGTGGQWGLIHGIVCQLCSDDSPAGNSTGLSILVSTAASCEGWRFPAGMMMRLDKRRMVDLGQVAVGGLAQFLIPAGESSERMREIVVEGKSPEMGHWEGVEPWLAKKGGKTASILRRLIGGCNEAQRRAIEVCMRSEDVGIVKGLPGTGKTFVIVILCLMMVLEGKRVLVASHTNSAIDNVLRKLIGFGTCLFGLFIERHFDSANRRRNSHPSRDASLHAPTKVVRTLRRLLSSLPKRSDYRSDRLHEHFAIPAELRFRCLYCGRSRTNHGAGNSANAFSRSTRAFGGRFKATPSIGAIDDRRQRRSRRVVNESTGVPRGQRPFQRSVKHPIPHERKHHEFIQFPHLRQLHASR